MENDRLNRFYSQLHRKKGITFSLAVETFTLHFAKWLQSFQIIGLWVADLIYVFFILFILNIQSLHILYFRND